MYTKEESDQLAVLNDRLLAAQRVTDKVQHDINNIHHRAMSRVELARLDAGEVGEQC